MKNGRFSLFLVITLIIGFAIGYFSMWFLKAPLHLARPEAEPAAVTVTAAP